MTKPEKENKGKPFAIFSAIFIGIATVGFLIMPRYFDNPINEIEKTVADLYDAQNNTFDLIMLANLNNSQAQLFGNQVRILKKLNLDFKQIVERSQSVITMHRDSALNALNAAIVSKAVSQEQAVVEKNKIEDLLRNTSIRPDIVSSSLFNIYKEYWKKSADATKTLQKQIEDNRKIMGTRLEIKNYIWMTCVTFQSLGIILAVIALILKE